MSSYSHCKILIFKTPIAQKVFNTRGCHPLGQLIRVPTPFQFSELNFFLSWSQPESLMPMKQTLWKKLSPYSAIKNMRKTGEANYADPLVLLQLFPLSFRLFRDHTKGCLVAAALEFSQGYSARAWTEEKRISSKSLLVCSWGFSGITFRLIADLWRNLRLEAVLTPQSRWVKYLATYLRDWGYLRNKRCAGIVWNRIPALRISNPPPPPRGDFTPLSNRAAHELLLRARQPWTFSFWRLLSMHWLCQKNWYQSILGWRCKPKVFHVVCRSKRSPDGNWCKWHLSSSTKLIFCLNYTQAMLLFAIL